MPHQENWATVQIVNHTDLFYFGAMLQLKAVSETMTRSDINDYNINSSTVKSSYCMFVVEHVVKCWDKTIERIRT